MAEVEGCISVRAPTRVASPSVSFTPVSFLGGGGGSVVVQASASCVDGVSGSASLSCIFEERLAGDDLADSVSAQASASEGSFVSSSGMPKLVLLAAICVSATNAL